VRWKMSEAQNVLAEQSAFGSLPGQIISSSSPEKSVAT